MIKKRVLGELEKCYSIAPLIYQNKFHFLVAAEKNRCILFDQYGNEKTICVGKGPGGVMTMVQFRKQMVNFLQLINFILPMIQRKQKLLCKTPDNSGKWKINTL